jgi:UDP-N-acetylmuramoyl-L-alanyl-D-glutamate--2,6-diaminopimelate ligase
MKKVKEILDDIKVQEWIGPENPVISGIISDSRQAAEGVLFIAVKGTNVDAHSFIGQVVEKGVKVIVCEDIPAQRPDGVTFIRVDDSAFALGQMASNWFGRPSEKLKLVGVTGTNGKTTTVTLLYQLTRQMGYKAGLLSTVRNIIDNKVVEASHTTPDPLQLHRLMADMVDACCDYCFMEVSSHAAHQKRIAGLKFQGAVFSNLTQDHLDYHKTISEYLKAKKLFFDGLDNEAFALVNSDDKNGRVMLQNTSAHQYTYGLKTMANYKGKVIESHFDGMLITLDGTEVWTRFIGNFNAYNLLAVYSSAILLGFPKEEVLAAISNLGPVDGRFQYIKSKDNKTAIVDYAHTPDALENVLKTINELREGNQKIITVVGAGGNRDKTKRPLMAAITAKMSDQVILTSDNPRNEKPEDIIEDMKVGVLPPYNKRVLCIPDRREAIKTATMLAQPGDIVLVAGKGHETYQEVDGVKHHFDDREILAELFEIQ